MPLKSILFFNVLLCFAWGRPATWDDSADTDYGQRVNFVNPLNMQEADNENDDAETDNAETENAESDNAEADNAETDNAEAERPDTNNVVEDSEAISGSDTTQMKNSDVQSNFDESQRSAMNIALDKNGIHKDYQAVFLEEEKGLFDTAQKKANAYINGKTGAKVNNLRSNLNNHDPNQNSNQEPVSLLRPINEQKYLDKENNIDAVYDNFAENLISENNLDENNMDRQRRDVPEQTNAEKTLSKDQVSGTTNNIPINSDMEKERAIIKKHIQKLSDEELAQLMNSLSDDKRQLLQTIIKNDVDLQKREIVEKAPVSMGKVGEGSKSESNNNNQALDLNIQSSDESSNLKQKIDENNPQPSHSNSNEGLNNNQPSVDSPVNIIDKSKREAKYQNKNNIESDFISKDYGDPSEIIEEPYNPNPGSFKIKREMNYHYNIEDLKDQDVYRQIKQLEESFPKWNENENPKRSAESNMPSLVRVKRKEKMALMKVGREDSVCHFRAENDDEDNDEGTEFEDDGFEDRTSNLASCEANILKVPGNG